MRKSCSGRPKVSPSGPGAWACVGVPTDDGVACRRSKSGMTGREDMGGTPLQFRAAGQPMIRLLNPDKAIITATFRRGSGACRAGHSNRPARGDTPARVCQRATVCRPPSTAAPLRPIFWAGSGCSARLGSSISGGVRMLAGLSVQTRAGWRAGWRPGRLDSVLAGATWPLRRVYRNACGKPTRAPLHALAGRSLPAVAPALGRALRFA